MFGCVCFDVFMLDTQSLSGNFLHTCRKLNVVTIKTKSKYNTATVLYILVTVVKHIVVVSPTLYLPIKICIPLENILFKLKLIK